VNYRSPLPMGSCIFSVSSAEPLLVHCVFEYDSFLQFGGISIPYLSGMGRSSSNWQDAGLITEDVSMERSHCRVRRHVRTDINEGSADMGL
jgi:hypothetical protein